MDVRYLHFVSKLLQKKRMIAKKYINFDNNIYVYLIVQLKL